MWTHYICKPCVWCSVHWFPHQFMNIYIFSHVALECSATRWLTHRTETKMSVNRCCQQPCVFINSSLNGCEGGNIYPLVQWCNSVCMYFILVSGTRAALFQFCGTLLIKDSVDAIPPFTEACSRGARLLADLAVFQKRTQKESVKQKREMKKKHRRFLRHIHKKQPWILQLWRLPFTVWSNITFAT